MKNERISQLTNSLTVFNTVVPKDADSIAFFDVKSSRVIVIDIADYIIGNFSCYFEIRKLSDLNAFGSVHFANLDDFTARYPESEIEKYISSAHSARANANIDKYITAYIHLYRCYKSLAVLSRKGHSEFIDSFIDNCFAENTDHPGTICYFGNEVYKIFRLRKAVFEMFEPYFKNYDTYFYIFMLQNHYKFSDKELRKVRKRLKKSHTTEYIYPVAKKNHNNDLKLLA